MAQTTTFLKRNNTQNRNWWRTFGIYQRCFRFGVKEYH
jgi:hypothetical protein